MGHLIGVNVGRTDSRGMLTCVRRTPRTVCISGVSSDGFRDRAEFALAFRQTLALHAPDEEIDAVLAEERLVLEHEGRHAPMA